MSNYGETGCDVHERPTFVCEECALAALRAQVAQLEAERDEWKADSMKSGALYQEVGAELNAALARAEAAEAANSKLREALAKLADMACMDHDDDEHEPDCGVAIARAALLSGDKP